MNKPTSDTDHISTSQIYSLVRISAERFHRIALHNLSHHRKQTKVSYPAMSKVRDEVHKITHLSIFPTSVSVPNATLDHKISHLWAEICASVERRITKSLTFK